MDAAADLDVFLADFGVDATGPAAASFRLILSMPDRILGDAVQVVSTEYEAMFKTADQPDLKYKDQVTIGADVYEVREVLKLSDGLMSTALLSKVDP